MLPLVLHSSIDEFATFSAKAFHSHNLKQIRLDLAIDYFFWKLNVTLTR